MKPAPKALMFIICAFGVALGVGFELIPLIIMCSFLAGGLFTTPPK